MQGTGSHECFEHGVGCAAERHRPQGTPDRRIARLRRACRRVFPLSAGRVGRHAALPSDVWAFARAGRDRRLSDVPVRMGLGRRADLLRDQRLLHPSQRGAQARRRSVVPAQRAELLDAPLRAHLSGAARRARRHARVRFDQPADRARQPQDPRHRARVVRRQPAVAAGRRGLHVRFERRAVDAVARSAVLCDLSAPVRGAPPLRDGSRRRRDRARQRRFGVAARAA
ncbi:putative acyltransferase [Burkholderia mallei]|nr:putative acyltransferase [Burkholderia mallei]